MHIFFPGMPQRQSYYLPGTSEFSPRKTGKSCQELERSISPETALLTYIDFLGPAESSIFILLMMSITIPLLSSFTTKRGLNVPNFENFKECTLITKESNCLAKSGYCQIYCNDIL